MNNEKIKKNMVKVPAGEFLIGSDEKAIDKLARSFGWKKDWFLREMPQRKIYLDEFYIDITPVTIAEYEKFILETGRTASISTCLVSQSHDPAQPVTGITWADASAYAKWLGKRLPTESEWEKAASWDQATWKKNSFPWGDDFESSKCGAKLNKIHPVGQFPEGRSPCGCLDMCGLVWQWCDDWYEPEYYRIMPDKNPTGPGKGIYKSFRGGDWDSDIHLLRTTARSFNLPSFFDAKTGFRCAMTSK